MLELNLLKDLDSDQRAAVTVPLSNILCLANAGSGKTRVLVYRIAYLISQGQLEDSFLMLTFTTKAAREMMERIKGLLGKDKLRLTGGTFHSVALRFIKQYAHLLGFGRRVTVLDEIDAKDLMGVCREYYCATHEADRKRMPNKKLIAGTYSYCRNTGRTIRDYNETHSCFLPDELDFAEDVIEEYELRKRQMSALDFDDLLIKFDEMLDIPEFRSFANRRFTNVFVDEYQDINTIQNAIVRKLSSGGARLTAVGDDAQCIYGFRGSEVEFIRAFKATYDGAKVFPIRNNYRSMSGIVNLALAVINQSPAYAEASKEMLSTQSSNIRPNYVVMYDDRQQADYIVEEVIAAKNRGIPYKEMAVLSRMNRLPRGIELALTNAGIPVAMDCGIPFYTRAHIRLVLDYIKFLTNRSNQLSFWNLFGTAEGIGAKTAQKMFASFTSRGYDLDTLALLKAPKRAANDFEALVDCLQEGDRCFTSGGLGIEKGSLLQQLLDIFYKNYFSERMPGLFKDDVVVRRPDIDILRDNLLHFSDVDEFLERVALASEAREQNNGDCVRITTVHRAKGLEWDKVFLPFVNDQVFPASDDYEEERRLLYVAVTRARKELDILSVRRTMLLHDFFGDPSPFLDGVDSELLEHPQVGCAVPDPWQGFVV